MWDRCARTISSAMFKRLLTVSGFTALSRLTGLARDFLLAYFLGAGLASDAFMAAFRLPNTFRAVFGEGAFSNAFLPRFARKNTAEGRTAATEFANAVYSWQFVVQLLLLIVALIAMRWIILILAAGFEARPEQLHLAVNLTRITFPYLIMTVSVVQLSAMLNAVGKFAAAAAWSILLNLSMMVTLALSHMFPSAAYAAAWGVFLGGVAQLAFITVAAAREALHLKIRLPHWGPEMKEFFLAFGAATIGSASVPISVLIDTQIASFLPAGNLTALYFADRINQLPTGILAIALGTVLLPEISNLLAKNKTDEANRVQNRSAAMGLFLTLPFVAAFFAIPDAIVAPFAHGKFGADAAHAVSLTLMAYGCGLPALVLIRTTAAGFYARGDTKTPMRATLSAFVGNVILKLILVAGFGFGVAGIALGTAAGAWINLIMLYVYARRQNILQMTADFRRALPPSVLGAVLTGAGAFLAIFALRPVALPQTVLGDFIRLFAAMITGGIPFIAIAYLFRRTLPLRRR